jgi:hypothetical protein
MTKPRSEPRSGASSHLEQDAAALRRALYRPGADRDAVLAYLAAAEAERSPQAPPEDGRGPDGSTAPDQAADVGAPVEDSLPEPADAAPAGPRAKRWRRIAVVAAFAVAVPTVGVALLPRPAPTGSPVPRPTATVTTLPVAPATFEGLRGGATLLVSLPFRTERVRVRVQCDRQAFYGWTALGEDAQTEQFVPVMRHTGGPCFPGDSYIGSLPGDVSALRILVVVEGGSYTLTVEPL